MRQENTKEKLIELAGDLIRRRGYSAFSYADLAEEIGIRKASIHHHFPSKADLGVAVAEANCAKIQAAFDEIERNLPSLTDRLTAYLQLFADCQRLPMCAALAADKQNLPDELTAHAQQHFQMQLAWLEKILHHAVEKGEIPACNVADNALMILNLCEGASLVAKALNDETVFERTKAIMLSVVL